MVTIGDRRKEEEMNGERKAFCFVHLLSVYVVFESTLLYSFNFKSM